MDEFWGLSATGWTAIYTLITGGLLVGAAVAAIFAGRQWALARTAQLEASRPYVIVTVEPSHTSQHLFDLVVKNIGQRPAERVSIKLDPAPIQANEDIGHELAQAKMLTEPVAMIAPGQEMRALYDSHLRRSGRDDLPTSHQVSLRYQDSTGRKYTETSVLDIDALRGITFVEVRTVHDIAKELREIKQTLKKASALKSAGTIQIRGTSH